MKRWDDLRYFIEVARAGTLLGAARTLDVEPSTVQRRVAALEQEWATTLFARGPRGHTLTPAGEEVLVQARQVEDEIARLEALTTRQDAEPRGTVRLTCTDDLVALLAPDLATFSDQYPEIRCQLMVAERHLDLLTGEADVALRFDTSATHPQLEVEKVGTLAFAPYASRSYLNKFGRPRRLQDLSRHRVVLGGRELVSNVAAVRWLHERANPDRVASTANTFMTLLTATRAGLGVAVLPCFLGEPEPELVRLFRPIPKTRVTASLVHAVSSSRIQRVTLLLGALRAAFKRNRAALGGHRGNQK
ncbi:LysR family transcriptional regulator [Planctomycetota bacterium]|nr:LysR family transcriptional regulator [Planctomycetota bacterium]